MRSFVGLISYYRRFIQDFSKISKPLFELTKKDQPYEWKEPQNKAFEILKEKLINSPVLIYPNFEKEFILLTDASKIALGAILSQKDDNNKEHPIAYDSKVLTKYESNYDTTRLEASAIIWAVKKFRPYLHGRKFKIITDHNALIWLLNSDRSNVNSKYVRWRLFLQEFDYEIVHRKGRIHQSVDALSRIPINSRPPDHE